MALVAVSRSGHSMPDRMWQRYRQWWAQQLPLPCARCGEVIRPGEEFHLDHMIPRWAGGGDDTCRPSHPHCNVMAGQDNPGKHRLKRIGLVADVPASSSRRW